MVQTQQLLIIEDDLNLTLALYRALSHTYKVTTAKTAASGLRKAETLPLDLIILDLNLPDNTGLNITQRLRQIGINTPILVLSGESGLITKIDLLDSGANDYVTKPFSLAELRSRIRVMLRYSQYPTGSVLVSGELVLDSRTHIVTINSFPLPLRRKEFAILECLLRNSNTAVSRAYLKDYGWGNQARLSTNTIDVHIKNLRDKLSLYEQAPEIRTVHGVGYCLEASKPMARV